MKLTQTITATVGDDGMIELREPTDKEWNDFIRDRYPIKRGSAKVKDESSSARVTLFDKLVVSIENIEDEEGPITVKDLDRIPGRLKGDVIFKALESREDVEVGN